MSSTTAWSDSFAQLGIPSNHVDVGLSNLLARHKQYRSLFVHRRLPDVGWSDARVQHLLYTLSTLDTNGDDAERWCGVGEREGRVFSSLVSQRHFGAAHGLGRSGDLAEAQPKALGSTVLARLTLALTLDAVRRGAGLHPTTAAAHGILLPLCTGMTMSLLLSTLWSAKKQKIRQQQQQEHDDHDYDYCVLWCRIDQKSCLKAVLTAGLRVVVVPTIQKGDEVVTDVEALRQAIVQEHKNIVAVISTTSCFAPRVPDPVDEIARLCQQSSVGGEIPHIINNAYGLQCAVTSKLINRACVVGRVDAIVFSMDKNFMVPVGGAVIVSPSPELVRNVGRAYAGRGSAASVVDLFITLLSMGLEGYRTLLTRRTTLAVDFRKSMEEVAVRHHERVLSCPRNGISFGMTLDGLATTTTTQDDDAAGREVSYLGAMLFTRCVSGTRVVPRCQTKTVCEIDFRGFGSSTDAYPHAYLTAACAVGLTASEMTEFFKRLDKAMKDLKTKQKKKRTKQNKEKEEVAAAPPSVKGESEQR